MSQERDTHFANAAELLFERTMATKALDSIYWRDDEHDELCTLFAQFAYDLAYHFIESHYEHRGTFRGEIHLSVQMLPDLTEWPKGAADLTQWPESPPPLPDAPTEQVL